MTDDKDIKKIIEAMREVFPTAKMISDSFDGVATKEQVEKIDSRLAKVESKLNSVLSEEIESLKQPVRVLEDSLEI